MKGASTMTAWPLPSKGDGGPDDPYDPWPVTPFLALWRARGAMTRPLLRAGDAAASFCSNCKAEVLLDVWE